MLCGLLVTPPHDESDLLAAFHVRMPPFTSFYLTPLWIANAATPL